MAARDAASSPGGPTTAGDATKRRASVDRPVANNRPSASARLSARASTDPPVATSARASLSARASTDPPVATNSLSARASLSARGRLRFIISADERDVSAASIISATVRLNADESRRKHA